MTDIDIENDLVTCDGCDATDESGWGDSPLCLDCEAPENICPRHNRTTYGGGCILCDDEGDLDRCSNGCVCSPEEKAAAHA